MVYRSTTVTRPGYADVPFTQAKPILKLLAAGLFGFMGLLGLAIVVGAVVMAAWANLQGHDEWPVMLVVGLVGIPLLTTPLFGYALNRPKPNSIERRRLESLAERLGGRWHHLESGALSGLQPELRVDVDGIPARFVAFHLRANLATDIFANAMSEPWAQVATGPFETAVRLHMLTNQRAPYFISIVSRTRLANFRTDIPEVRLPEPIGSRIACFASEPDRLRRSLTPELIEGIRSLLESNHPYLTRVRFDEGGGHWESLWTERTDAEAMGWRLQTMEWIAARLRDDVSP